MDIRYSASPKDVKRYTTQELRDEFLITDLYQPDTVQATYSHVAHTSMPLSMATVSSTGMMPMSTMRSTWE